LQDRQITAAYWVFLTKTAKSQFVSKPGVFEQPHGSAACRGRAENAVMRREWVGLILGAGGSFCPDPIHDSEVCVKDVTRRFGVSVGTVYKQVGAVAPEK
jgi:hypothetical protein